MDMLAQAFLANPPTTVEDMRRLLDGFGGFLNAGLPEVGAFHEAIPAGEAGEFTSDVIVPSGDGPHPVLVYLHGGGWICGSPTTHRKLAHRFAEAGYLVFNVDYRMAPEHPFPVPFDDCVAAVRWAAREAARFGGDATRLAVGGDSAGGNLSAAVAAAMANDPSGPQLKAALLIYGVFDFAKLGIGPAEGPMAEMGANLVELMMGSYLGSERSDSLLRDPRVSPLHAVAKLPPCHVVCGTADPLIEQARELPDALADAGVHHEYVEDAGMPHGYAQMEMLPGARPAIERMVRFLDEQLG
jgi:acetyl esterase